MDSILELLKNAGKSWGSRVYRDYPPSFNILPVVAVSIIAQLDKGTGDDRGLGVYKKTISIDVWCKSGEEKIIDEIQETMQIINSLQTNLHEIKEDSLSHLVFTYKIF